MIFEPKDLVARSYFMLSRQNTFGELTPEECAQGISLKYSPAGPSVATLRVAIVVADTTVQKNWQSELQYPVTQIASA